MKNQVNLAWASFMIYLGQNGGRQLLQKRLLLMNDIDELQLRLEMSNGNISKIALGSRLDDIASSTASTLSEMSHSDGLKVLTRIN